MERVSLLSPTCISRQEWNLALQLLQRALGAKADRHGESHEVRRSVRARIPPSLRHFGDSCPPARPPAQPLK